MARARTAEEIDAQIERLKERERQLKAQKQALKKRQSAQERKQRNHALMVYGAMVEQHLGRGNWTRLDPQAVSAYLARFGKSAPARECAGEPRPAAEANEAVRAWEKAGREARKADAAAVEKALEG
jgi:hypothetical protein